jgi:hypothetical protein
VHKNTKLNHFKFISKEANFRVLQDARMDLHKATWRSSDQHLKQGQGAPLKTLEYKQEVQEMKKPRWKDTKKLKTLKSGQRDDDLVLSYDFGSSQIDMILVQSCRDLGWLSNKYKIIRFGVWSNYAKIQCVVLKTKEWKTPMHTKNLRVQSELWWPQEIWVTSICPM